MIVRSNRSPAGASASAAALAPHCVAVFVFCIAACCVAEALAQTTDDATSIVLIYERACSDAGTLSLLREELASRLPDVAIVDDGGPGWQVAWVLGSGGRCQLQTADGEVLPLSALAGREELIAAASRLAWLYTARVVEEVPPAPDGPSASEVSAAVAVGAQRVAASLSAARTSVARSAEDIDERPDEINTTAVADTSALPVPELRHEPFGATLVPGVSTVADPGNTRLRFSLNAVGAELGALRGAELGLFANRERFQMQGAQFTFGLNLVAGQVRGAQIAGLGNFARGAVVGAQLSTVVNWSEGSTNGAQAGALNVAQGRLRGVQAAGLLNLAMAPGAGVQASPVANVASADFRGAQVGLLNVGRDVRGVQLGLLNIARESDASIGLISVNYGRPLYASAWADGTGFTNVGLQHGSRYVYGLAAVGARPSTAAGRDGTWQAGLGLGVHVPLAPFYLAGDVTVFLIEEVGRFGSDHRHGVVRFLFGWEIRRRLALYGGPVVHSLSSKEVDGLGVPPSRAQLDESGPDGDPVWIWTSFQVGLRF